MIFLTLLFWPFSIQAAGGIGIMIVGGGTPISGGASGYFGYCGKTNTTCSSAPEASPSYDAWASGTSGILIANTDTYTCPGSGTKTINYLKIYSKSAGGTTGNASIGVYSTDRTTCYCSVSYAATGSGAWLGGVTGGLTGTCQITGGTSYMIFWQADIGNNDASIASVAATGGDKYVAGLGTMAIPYDVSALTLSTDNNKILVAVGVE